MFLTSAAVVTIGVLTFPVLRRQYRRAASSYLVTHVVEVILLAAPAVGILTLALTNPTGAAIGDGRSGLPGLLELRGERHHHLLGRHGGFRYRQCGVLSRSHALRTAPSAARAGRHGGLLRVGPRQPPGTRWVPRRTVALSDGGLFEVVAGSYLLFKGFRQVTPVGRESVGRISNEALLRP